MRKVMLCLAMFSAAMVGVGEAATPQAVSSVLAVSSVSIPIHISDLDRYGNTLGDIDGHVVVGAESDTTCQLATIQQATLRITSNAFTSCNNPLLDGANVMPVESITPRFSNYGEVRIAVRNQTRRSIRLGPVVMRYGNFSDTRPEWIYGDGYLWLYDVGTDADSNGPKLPAEVLRISLSTGDVLAAVHTRALSRITLAADRDGLWIAPSQETGWPEHTGRPALLYFLSLTAAHPAVVQPQSGEGEYVNWLVADSHTAFVNVVLNSSDRESATETFDSPHAKPVTVSDSAKTPMITDIGEGSFDTPAVLDANGFGLVAPVPNWVDTAPSGEPVVLFKLEPTTGSFSTAATFTNPGTVVGDIVANEAIYLLVAREQSASALTLYRIAF